MASAAASKDRTVFLVGINNSKEAFYALEWTLRRHFSGDTKIGAASKLVVIYAKPTPSSVIGIGGLGYESISAHAHHFTIMLAKVVPAAKKFRYSGIQPELEEKMNMMFSSVVATGHHACTPHSRNVGPESTEDRALSNGGQEDDDVTGVPPAPENTATSEVGHRRRKGQKKDITAVLEDMAESSRTMCRFMQEPPKSNSSFPIAQALEKLGTYHEVQSDKAFHFFAITYLMDKNHRETFMCLPEGLNVEWLRSRYTSGV
ncbi:hypothetical protein KSP39_PZI002708 [Platanthera zijinensis]|uniref:Uncharacterized protein n=1 Tax=Platanthera zijinensis TaxID=2320716 RepID=A0AAP0BXH1_9ASPA